MPRTALPVPRPVGRELYLAFSRGFWVVSHSSDYLMLVEGKTRKHILFCMHHVDFIAWVHILSSSMFDNYFKGCLFQLSFTFSEADLQLFLIAPLSTTYLQPGYHVNCLFLESRFFLDTCMLFTTKILASKELHRSVPSSPLLIVFTQTFSYIIF